MHGDGRVELGLRVGQNGVDVVASAVTPGIAGETTR
jgi:hypothetical protein